VVLLDIKILNANVFRMSTSKDGVRWFRVYSADRRTRKVVGASSLKEFIAEGKMHYHYLCFIGISLVTIFENQSSSENAKKILFFF
jgi:hypothetical protein